MGKIKFEELKKVCSQNQRGRSNGQSFVVQSTINWKWICWREGINKKPETCTGLGKLFFTETSVILPCINFYHMLQSSLTNNTVNHHNWRAFEQKIVNSTQETSCSIPVKPFKNANIMASLFETPVKLQHKGIKSPCHVRGWWIVCYTSCARSEKRNNFSRRHRNEGGKCANQLEVFSVQWWSISLVRI